MSDISKREYLDKEALDALVALCDREARFFSERSRVVDQRDRPCPYAMLNEVAEDLYRKLLDIAYTQSIAENAQQPYVVTTRHVNILLNQYGVSSTRFLVEE